MKCTGKLVILSTILMGLTACGGKDSKTTGTTDSTSSESKETTVATDNSASTALDGSWEIKRAEGMMSETNVGTVYTFNGNKLSFGKEGYTNPGRTEVTDNTFSFQAEGNELKFMYDYKMMGDTLVVEMQNSGGQRFYMVKR